MGFVTTRWPNQRVEPMTRSAVTLPFQSGITGALLVMAHPSSATIVVESGLSEPTPSPILPRPHPSTPGGGGGSTRCLLVEPPTDRRTTPATLLPLPGGCRRGPAAFLIALLISGPSLYLNDMSGS